MTIYVDPLMMRGWKLNGQEVKSCHLFTDSMDLGELHAAAKRIGMLRPWFQDADRAPHYDLTPGRRAKAIAAGAVSVTNREAVRIWKARRAAIEAKVERAADEILQQRKARP